MSEILNGDKESSDHRSESGDDTLSLDYDRDNRLKRSGRDRSRSMSRSPRRRRGIDDEDNEEASALIAALRAELAEAKKRVAQLTGEATETAEAAASGSSELLIPKEKADQFVEWLSGEVSAEDIKRIKAYCLSPRLEGLKIPFACPQLEIFYARGLKGKKQNEVLEKDLRTIQSRLHEALRPLLFTWVNVTEGDEMLSQAIADSIRLGAKSTSI